MSKHYDYNIDSESLEKIKNHQGFKAIDSNLNNNQFSYLRWNGGEPIKLWKNTITFCFFNDWEAFDCNTKERVVVTDELRKPIMRDFSESYFKGKQYFSSEIKTSLNSILTNPKLAMEQVEYLTKEWNGIYEAGNFSYFHLEDFIISDSITLLIINKQSIQNYAFYSGVYTALTDFVNNNKAIFREGYTTLTKHKRTKPKEHNFTKEQLGAAINERYLKQINSGKIKIGALAKFYEQKSGFSANTLASQIRKKASLTTLAGQISDFSKGYVLLNPYEPQNEVKKTGL